VSGHERGEIIFWDTTTHKKTGSLLTADGLRVQHIAFSPDGKRLISAAADDYYRSVFAFVFDLASRKPIVDRLSVSDSNARAFVLSDDGRILAVDNDASKLHCGI